MVELAWEFEKKRSALLRSLLTNTIDALSIEQVSTRAHFNHQFRMVIEDDLSDSKLQTFAYVTDMKYGDAWTFNIPTPFNLIRGLSAP